MGPHSASSLTESSVEESQEGSDVISDAKFRSQSVLDLNENPLDTHKSHIGEKVGIVFWIFLSLRVLVLTFICMIWAVNVLLGFFGVWNGFVPDRSSSIWTTFNYNSISIMDQFMYPIDPPISDPYIGVFFRLAMSGIYFFELFICTLLAILGFVMGFASLQLCQTLLKSYLGCVIICLLMYIIGAVNFCIAVDFETFYWIDIGLVIINIIIILIRMMWVNSMLSLGLKKVTKLNAIGDKNYDERNQGKRGTEYALEDELAGTQDSEYENFTAEETLKLKGKDAHTYVGNNAATSASTSATATPYQSSTETGASQPSTATSEVSGQQNHSQPAPDTGGQHIGHHPDGENFGGHHHLDGQHFGDPHHLDGQHFGDPHHHPDGQHFGDPHHHPDGQHFGDPHHHPDGQHFAGGLPNPSGHGMLGPHFDGGHGMPGPHFDGGHGMPGSHFDGGHGMAGPYFAGRQSMPGPHFDGRQSMAGPYFAGRQSMAGNHFGPQGPHHHGEEHMQHHPNDNHHDKAAKKKDKKAKKKNKKNKKNKKSHKHKH